MSEIEVVAGDLNYILKFVIRDADGILEDLSGASLLFNIRKYGESTLTASLANTSGTWSPANGECAFRMTIPLTEGNYEAEIQITKNDGSIITVPDLVIHVLEQLG